MYCPKCGAQNTDSAAFCQSCGQAVSQGVTPGATPTPASQQVYQAATTGAVPHIPSYLGWAIVSILLCWPTGIPATVYASRVDGLVTIGNLAAAHEASRKAKTWATVSTVLFVIWLLIVIIAVAVGGRGPLN
jgi:hypothetical protein